MSGNRQFIKHQSFKFFDTCERILTGLQYSFTKHYPSWPDRVRGIRENSGMCGIFESPQYHLTKIILGLDKYLKGL